MGHKNIFGFLVFLKLVGEARLTIISTVMFLLLVSALVSCAESGNANQDVVYDNDNLEETNRKHNHLTTGDYINDIVNHPAFEGFGELLLPRDNNSGHYNTVLKSVAALMPYHGHVVPEDVVEALNCMIDDAIQGNKIFYDFYNDGQKQNDPSKKNTGLFFLKGNPGAPFALICPGGGFSYVGSLHEGFPLAEAISKKGYNSFVIRYRIGGEQIATEDLAAAISYIFKNASELGVDTARYALIGGSAGARMVGNIALNGVSAYGGDRLPKPAVAVIAYTGQSSYSDKFPPTFITVAANDPIVNVSTVDLRVANLRNSGVEVEYRKYKTAGHGFGLGTGSDAEGWLDVAVDFWERHFGSENIQGSLHDINYLLDDGIVPASKVYTTNNYKSRKNENNESFFSANGFDNADWQHKSD